jgi:hypothetical protein
MIRIFVGCASGDDLESQAVLEHSLRRHTRRRLEIVWMQLSRDPASPFYSDGRLGWQTQQWSTPFSGFRWAVPSLCGFQGRALYLDSDCIARADIGELWDQTLAPGKIVLAKGGQDSWRFCVSLWDCAAAQPHLWSPPRLRSTDAHAAMISLMRNSNLVQPFDGAWNCIDGEDFGSIEDPRIKLIHYSSEAHQPHLRHAVPRLHREEDRAHWFDGKRLPHWRKDLVALFDRELEAAKAAGFAPENYAPAVPFGAYALRSHKNQAHHRWVP